MMYTRKFLSLDGATRLIADRLKVGDPQAYADDQAAVESARMQLLAALYEGAVRAEGVWWEIPGEEKEPAVDYDIWHPVDQGLWSHQRYEKESDGEVVRLDTIGLGWRTSTFSLYDNAGGLTEREIHKIRIHVEDIEREFPDVTSPDLAPTSPNESMYNTGLAGRPTSIHLVRSEMYRRAEAGTLCESVRAEAQELADWLPREHPGAARATAKTIENAIRNDHRKLKASMNLGSPSERVPPK